MRLDYVCHINRYVKLFLPRSCYTILVMIILCLYTPLFASPNAQLNCSQDSRGFDKFLESLHFNLAKLGYNQQTLAALKQIKYSYSTIDADRKQKSFKLSLPEFMKLRGASYIIAHGRKLKQTYRQIFLKIEKEYGVPSGPLLAIWGMESNFGQNMGKQNILSAIATLSFDCRRSAFFTEQLYALFNLIDQGNVNPSSIGAMHGEIGQTQFLPLNVIRYGVDADKDGRVDLIYSSFDALASTANFLKQNGWKRNQAYQINDENFKVLQRWNKAQVYQKALAIIGKKIDE